MIESCLMVVIDGCINVWIILVELEECLGVLLMVDVVQIICEMMGLVLDVEEVCFDFIINEGGNLVSFVLFGQDFGELCEVVDVLKEQLCSYDMFYDIVDFMQILIQELQFIMCFDVQVFGLILLDVMCQVCQVFYGEEV